MIPIPTPAALGDADGRPARPALPRGLRQNRYIGRTFIMPGQATRRKSVRQKLNTIHPGVQGAKSVLLVDDSIVRGTTSKRSSTWRARRGRRSISPRPRRRCASQRLGIDVPTRGELIASDRSEEEICREIGADASSTRTSTTSRPRCVRSTPRCSSSRPRVSTATTSPATSPSSTSTASRTSAAKEAGQERPG